MNMMPLFRYFASSLLYAALLAGPVTRAAAQAAGPSAGDWASYNGSLTGIRHTPLHEITPANVARLRLVAHFDPGGSANFQTGPVVIQGTMFLTDYENTYAIDAATGRLKWKQHRPSRVFGLAVNRGVAYADGRLFRSIGDDSVLALDAATGKTLWVQKIADIGNGERIPMAPLCWHGMVFIGTAGGDNFGVTGRIYALDDATGKPVWRFDTVPQTGPAAATWTKKSAANPPTGGAIWSTYSLNPDTGILYATTGNVAPDFAENLHPGENLYANCVLALDASTGKLLAFTQVTKHDFHDWDAAAAPALITTRAGRHLAATGGKDGLLHGIEVSAVIRPTAASVQTPTLGASLYGSAGRGAMKTLYSTPVTRRFNTETRFNTSTYTRFAPGAQGGVEWNGPSYDAAENLIVVPAVDWAFSIKLVTDAKRPRGRRGKPWTGESAGGFGKTDPTSQWGGYLTAIDADSGHTRWKYRAAAPMLGAVTTSSGGLVFAGDLTGALRAFSTRTGRVLWTDHTGRPIGGGLVSYAAGGHQYLAVVEGMTNPIWPTKKTPPRLAIYRLP